MERLPLKSKVLNENQIVAESLRERFREHGILCLNLISGPGSGKTALLERTLASLDRSTRVCVLTGDIQTDNDARRLAQRLGFQQAHRPVAPVRHRERLAVSRERHTVGPVSGLGRRLLFEVRTAQPV